jgi:hypothetical protein
VSNISYVLLLCLSTAVFAQQPTNNANPMASMPGMDNIAPVNLIDGKDHPELIPDLTAYHLYFMAVGELPNSDAKALARQRSSLAQMQGMKTEDSQSIANIISAYKLQWTAMAGEYNARVDAAVRIQGTLPDSEAFLRQRDQLVQLYLTRLKQALSPDAMTQFANHIQVQKAHMKITAPEGQ